MKTVIFLQILTIALMLTLSFKGVETRILGPNFKCPEGYRHIWRNFSYTDSWACIPKTLSEKGDWKW